MAERPSWKQWPNVFSVLLIVLLLTNYLVPFGDMDYGILIRLGELILRTGELRPPESFSYTIAGRDIPDFEWLFEVLIWGVWTVFGYGGLKLLKTLLVGGTLLLLSLRLRREGVRWHGIALSLIVAVLTLAAGWNLRPLYFTTLGLLLVSGWLHDHCTGRRPLSWWLPLTMLLWANLHPGVITGQGLLAGAIVWEWLNRWVKLNQPLDLAACRRLTLVGGLGLAATFVSPAPIERLLCPFQPEVRHPVMRVFTEMRPLYQAALTPPYVDALAYVVAAVVLVTVLLRFRQYRLWEIALLSGTGLLANMATRSTQDWVLVMLALGVPHVAILLRQWAKAGRRRVWVAILLRTDCTCKRLLNSPLLRFQWFWPALAVGLLAVVSLIPPISRQMPIQDSSEYAIGAANWIEANGKLLGPGPWHVFASPDNGAYLVWRLGDRVRCYVDCRGFCYPSELMEDGVYLQLCQADWRPRLERVLNAKTDYFLLTTIGGAGNLWRQLEQKGAQPLYQDNEAVLLTAAEVREALARMDGKSWTAAEGQE